MTDDVFITISEEEAYRWLRLCRSLADNPETPHSIQGLCDLLSIRITRAMTHSKAS